MEERFFRLDLPVALCFRFALSCESNVHLVEFTCVLAVFIKVKFDPHFMVSARGFRFPSSNDTFT
jgi:hypothetical protein